MFEVMVETLAGEEFLCERVCVDGRACAGRGVDILVCLSGDCLCMCLTVCVCVCVHVHRALCVCLTLCVCVCVYAYTGYMCVCAQGHVCMPDCVCVRGFVECFE